MTVLVLLSVVAIALLVIVLAFFLVRLTRLLRAISVNLGRVAWGVRAVETMCATIGPAADDINANLTAAAAGLERAAVAAERFGA